MNYVNVIYRTPMGDLAGKKVAWEDHERLAAEFQDADIIAVHIQHVQNGNTNTLKFNGNDAYYLKFIGNAGLMVRCFTDTSPGLPYAKTWFLRLNGQQDSPKLIPSHMINHVSAGMNVQLLGYNWREDDHEVLTDASNGFDLDQCELIQ